MSAAKFDYEMYREFIVMISNSKYHKSGDIGLLCHAVHKQYNPETDKPQTFLRMEYSENGRVVQTGLNAENHEFLRVNGKTLYDVVKVYQVAEKVDEISKAISRNLGMLPMNSDRVNELSDIAFEGRLLLADAKTTYHNEIKVNKATGFTEQLGQIESTSRRDLITQFYLLESYGNGGMPLDKELNILN